MTLQKTKPKRPTTATRRRAGQHHRHGKSYLKTYWPYLPILVVLVMGFLTNTWLTHLHHNVLGYATDVSPQALLEQTNAQRTTDHEGVLHLNTELTAAAQAKANDMAKRNYWSHVTPDGRQPWWFITHAGYNYQTAGENLAYGFGTSTQVMDAWMHSTEHRANILDGSYTDVGFATANAQNYQGNGPETIVVAMYGEPIASTAAAPVTNAAEPTVDISHSAQSVSRVQLAFNATWVQLAVAVLCGAAATLFIVRHGLAWHKMLVRGEQFVLHHPAFDILLVIAAVFGFVLSRAVGTIL